MSMLSPFSRICLCGHDGPSLADPPRALVRAQKKSAGKGVKLPAAVATPVVAPAGHPVAWGSAGANGGGGALPFGGAVEAQWGAVRAHAAPCIVRRRSSYDVLHGMHGLSAHAVPMFCDVYCIPSMRLYILHPHS